jgi:hypothetical protein
MRTFVFAIVTVTAAAPAAAPAAAAALFLNHCPDFFLLPPFVMLQGGNTMPQLS